MVFKFQFVELNIAYMAVWLSKEIKRLFLFWRRCSLWTKQITTLDFTRIVPMFADVQTALLQTRRKQMENGFNQCVVDGYSNFVFQNRYGEMLTPHVVNRAIERIIRDCNQTEVERAKQECREPVLLPHFSVHNLRHTFCTRLCENETNLKIIQEIMGHRNIKTTMDVYNEASKERKVASFASLEGKIKIS